MMHLLSHDLVIDTKSLESFRKIGEKMVIFGGYLWLRLLGTMGGLIAGLIIHVHLITILSMECVLTNRLGNGSLESPLSVVVVSEVGDSRFGKNEIVEPLRKNPCETTTTPMADIMHVC